MPDVYLWLTRWNQSITEAKTQWVKDFYGALFHAWKSYLPLIPQTVYMSFTVVNTSLVRFICDKATVMPVEVLWFSDPYILTWFSIGSISVKHSGKRRTISRNLPNKAQRDSNWIHILYTSFNPEYASNYQINHYIHPQFYFPDLWKAKKEAITTWV